MRIGDFFVTKHSNLGHVHVVINFACKGTKLNFSNLKLTTQLLLSHCNNNEKSSGGGARGERSEEEMMLLGLRNVLDFVSRYHVRTLVLPVLMLGGGSIPEEMIADDVCVKRAEVVLKTVKSFLASSPSDNCLKEVRFLFPPVSDEVFKKYKNTIARLYARS
eukprot:TRINITY_DN11675_c0_g1_i1.p2 TRINITY_DN11675_c0_g1~~TRINITY_DN11675_c0_g1_i1.p2  ORF type:complete len:162 (+),score=63.23 TRINITY_DN11675_c0_g1_i1:106-591(+)